MQLDVGMELTFGLVNVIYKCICTVQINIRMHALINKKLTAILFKL